MAPTVERLKRTGVSPVTLANGDDAIGPMLARCVAGDYAAWGLLFDHLAPRLFGFLLRCLGERTLAEAYLEATFLELHRRRRTYLGDAPVPRFVFSVALRARVDGHRCLDHPGTPRSGENAAVASAYAQTGERNVQHALDELSSRERAIIHLHRFERMTLKEIAEVLGSTEAAVQRQTRFAYHRLHRRLWVMSGHGDEQ